MITVTSIPNFQTNSRILPMTSISIFQTSAGILRCLSKNSATPNPLRRKYILSERVTKKLPTSCQSAAGSSSNSSEDDTSITPSKEPPTPQKSAALSSLERARAYKANKGVHNAESTTGTKISTKTPEPPAASPATDIDKVNLPYSSQAIAQIRIQAGEAQSTASQPPNVVSIADMDSPWSYGQQQNELLAALQESSAAEPSKSLTSSVRKETSEDSSPQPVTEKQQQSLPAKLYEVEIFTRDGVVRKSVSKPGDMTPSPAMKNQSQALSSTDFIGLNFEDKKDSRATPAGLRVGLEMPSGALPQVEILTRQAPDDVVAQSSADGTLYKPKVSTWGVFPRPKDISKSYGGGRTIRPGEALETPEEKEAREKKTRQLLEEYRREAGLDMNPQVEAQCEAAMARGSHLMSSGNLTDAIQEFDKIMEMSVFKSLPHGKAMLQKAICLDSIAISQTAKGLYEKLSTHPDPVLKKKARQMLFGFEAAENLRVREGLDFDTSAYRKYFDSFAEGYNNIYSTAGKEQTGIEWSQVLPYIILLVSPIVFVYIMAVSKH